MLSARVYEYRLRGRGSTFDNCSKRQIPIFFSLLNLLLLLYSSFLSFSASLVDCHRYCCFCCSRLTAPHMSSKIVLARPLLIRRWTTKNCTPRSLIRSERLCMYGMFVTIKICFYAKGSHANVAYVAEAVYAVVVFP